MRSIELVDMKAPCVLPQSIGIASGSPSSSYHFVGSQAENLFYLNPHHTLATVPLDCPHRRRLQRVSVESRLGKPRVRRDQYHPHLPTDITRVQRAAPARLHSPTQPPRHHLYQNNYSRAALPPEAHVRWNSAGTNEARVGAVGRGCQRCGFGCYADALGDVV